MLLLDAITIEEAKEQAEAAALDGFEAGIDAVRDHQRDVAKKLWPRGAMLICRECDRRQTASTIELATFLGSGWPTCHGETMWLGDALKKEER